MSTKSSIAHGKGFHFYHEVFDEENIHLSLEGVEFTATPGEIRVAIPLEIWEVIRTRGGADLPWAERSDEEIIAHVAREVDKRIRAAEKHGAGPGFLSGSFIYGAPEDACEEQIERGVTYYRRVRDQETRIARAIQELEAAQRTPPE